MNRREYLERAILAAGAIGLSGCTFNVDSAGNTTSSTATTVSSPSAAPTSAGSQTPAGSRTPSATPTGGPEINRGSTTQAERDTATAQRTPTRTPAQTSTRTRSVSATATPAQGATETIQTNRANELLIEYIEGGSGEGSYTVYFSNSQIEYGADADQHDGTDVITGSRASGSINSGTDNYFFGGQLTRIDYGGNLRFSVNGDVVEANPPTATETNTAMSTTEPTIDARITSFDPETGTFSPGEVQNATVTVINTGNVSYEFFIGYSARDPSGEGRPPPGQPASLPLDPGQTGSATVDWPVTDDVPTGTYGAFTTVRESWSESEGYGETLDSAEESNVFEVVSSRR